MSGAGENTAEEDGQGLFQRVVSAVKEAVGTVLSWVSERIPAFRPGVNRVRSDEKPPCYSSLESPARLTEFYFHYGWPTFKSEANVVRTG